MTVAVVSNPRGWLRSVPYDLTLILGVAGVALASGWAAVARPELFPVLLFLDLWLLGYHHVVSTFTRLAFDRQSFLSHRFLVLGLPFLVLGAVLLAGALTGGWILSTTYLYWQWFHYTRQSYGIERVYRRRASGSPGAGDGGVSHGVPGAERPTRWMLYAVPLWGILYRSYQSPETFLGIPLKTLPVPWELVQLSGVVALGLSLWWVGCLVRSLMAGEPLRGHSLYLISHLVIFTVGYVVIDDLDHGWLVANIWHNAQYILFVWHFNASRFRDGVDPKSRLLSSLSQPKNLVWYFLTCLGISTLAYFGLDRVLEQLAGRSTLPLFLVAYQTINFHHYLVDGLIWKVRKKPMSKTLGLPTPDPQSLLPPT